VNAVATPKLPPPPRSAQKRSGCESASTWRTSPSADPEQVVGGEAVLGHQPAETAAEREAGDPGRRDDAAGHREAVRGGRVVQLAPEHAAAGGHGRALPVDRDPLHLGQVDHQAAVRHGTPGDVVAAAADRDLQSRPAGELERRDDVGRRPAADDQGGPAVDEAVVHGPGRVVARVPGPEHGAGDPGGEIRDERVVEVGEHRGPFRSGSLCVRPGCDARLPVHIEDVPNLDPKLSADIPRIEG